MLAIHRRTTLADRSADCCAYSLHKQISHKTDLPAKPLESEELGADSLYGLDDQSGIDIVIDFTTLRETFDTAFFSGRAEQRLGWDHRSLSEFLAAKYCKSKRIQLKDVRKLILAQAVGQIRVAQQLYETAAWLCVFYPGLIKTVIKNDPMVLLRSDVLKDNEEIRYGVNGTICCVSNGRNNLRTNLGQKT